VKDSTNAGFALNLDVLNPTDVTKLTTDFSFVLPVAPAAATTVDNTTILVNGVAKPSLTGVVIDYTKPVKISLKVTQDGITFWATYTITVTVVK